MNLGYRIRGLRKEKGWSQHKLAEVLGISTQVVSNWERSTNAPDHKTIIQLADIFDVSTDYLLSISNNRKSERTHVPDKLDLEGLLLTSNDVYFNNLLLSKDDKQMCIELLRVATMHTSRIKNSLI